MPDTHRQRIGRWGEATAAEYLSKRGYDILGRNARTRYGEIDLLARAPEGMLVFVEVKTRTSRSFGYPEEAVDARKLGHLVSSAEAYLLEHPEMEAGPDGAGWRIDVIAIEGRPGEEPDRVGIEHFENISA